MIMSGFGNIDPLGITTLRFIKDLNNFPPEVRLHEIFSIDEVEEWGIPEERQMNGFIIKNLWAPGPLARRAEEDVCMYNFLSSLAFEPEELPGEEEDEEDSDMIFVDESLPEDGSKNENNEKALHEDITEKHVIFQEDNIFPLIPPKDRVKYEIRKQDTKRGKKRNFRIRCHENDQGKGQIKNKIIVCDADRVRMRKDKMRLLSSQ